MAISVCVAIFCNQFINTYRERLNAKKFSTKVYSTSLTDDCWSGMHKRRDRNITILATCEENLISYISLYYIGEMNKPKHGAWSLKKRYWSDKKWSTDVDSYIWGADGKFLYIATRGTEGDPAVYKLDVINQKYKVIAQPSFRKGNISFIILSADLKSKKLNVVEKSVPDMNDQKPKFKEITLGM